jgi:hypothetical protein
MKLTPSPQRAFSMLLLLTLSLRAGQAQAPQASSAARGPDQDMMAPVTALASYMAHVEGAVLPQVFVENGLTIVEDFAPYVFAGKDATAQWDSGFRKHAVPLKDLTFTFGPVHDFERTEDRVFFVLPTTWRGIYKDRQFEEHGAWSFVLINVGGQWRILAYGWGATDLQDRPAKPQ